MDRSKVINEFMLRRNVEIDGECPEVIVADIARRPRPDAHIIVVANEKGGVGKSTIAFHICIALAETGHAVTAVDIDRRQQTLARVLTNRDATARRLGVKLPRPAFEVLRRQTGSMLCQEICRIGWQSDYIIIDVAGHDSGIARRAIALADTLITPVNSSFVDLDLLGRFHPITLEVTSKGCFAATVEEIRQARVAQNLPDLDWVVVKNRMRHSNSKNQSRVTQALQTLAPLDRFRLASGLSERVAYRELFLLGLTYLDIKHMPELGRVKLRGPDEIGSLIRDLNLTAADTIRRGKSKSKIETVLELLNEWMETYDDGAG